MLRLLLTVENNFLMRSISFGRIIFVALLVEKIREIIFYNTIYFIII